MKSIVLGIHAVAGKANFQQTLTALGAHTPERHSTIVLSEDGEMPRVGDSIIVRRSTEALGPPAWFNRLVKEREADVYVLLQNGSLVGPQWLEELLAALTAHPRNGLAGPSTNRSWNQQGAFPRAGGTPADIAKTAQEAARRFGSEVRTLEPLYSLADFCYAVRREVIDDIGLADEGYELGPCWEMDYNIRAARAGWRGVWACASYVWRAPASPQRQREEAQLFQASKQRYQDKFCGGRLRGEKSDYRSHCRGDACPNFAPTQFQDRWLPKVPRAPVIMPAAVPMVITPAPAPTPSIEVVSPAAPLASCIMPTFNRRPFIAGAIRSFLNQDYPNLELLIVDDGTDPIQDQVPDDPRIRYLRLSEKKILGDKRNAACMETRGEFICHWDDDDWYPANRVSRQIAALHSAAAQICGSSRVFYLDPAANRAWRYSYATGARPWVAGNTLAYRRSFWQSHPFGSLQIGEDNRFVWADKSGVVADLKDPALCVARVHPGNTSRKATGGSCWQPVSVGEIESLMGAEFEGFRSISRPNPGPGSGPSDKALPLISCIMPTGNRRHFVQLAVRCFQQQDYPRRELIIVDDGQQNLSDLVAGLPETQYVRLPSRQSIGAKRNLACQKARGSIIAHWDDDDWYGPGRLSHQAEPLLRENADITGLESSYIFDLNKAECWGLSAALHQRMFVGNVHGGTLMYRKCVFDQGARYPQANLAEDAAFLNQAMRKGHRLKPLPNQGVFVYVRHGSNAWAFATGQFLQSTGWKRAETPPGFAAALRDYSACAVAKSPVA